MKHWRHILGTLFILSTITFGQTYLDFPIGTNWQFTDARTLGMGGAGIASLGGSASLMHNPATIGLQPAGLHIQLHPTLRKLQETRAYPLYNRIDDVIYQSIYAANNHYFTTWQGGISWKPRKPLFNHLIAVGAGLFTERNLDYRYNEEVRENVFGDSLLARNQLSYQGTIRRFTVGAVLRIVPWLNLGMQVGILRGNIVHDSTINFYRGDQNDVRVIQNWNLQNTPVVFSVGTLIRVTPHLSLGSVVQLPYTMRYQQFPDNALIALNFPLQFAIGMEYRARQELQTRLNIDFSYEFWSRTNSLRDDIPYLTLLQDSWAIKAGVEHIFFNKIPFRAGIQYRTSPRDRGTVQTAITAGTGFFGNGWQVDVAGGFSSLEYKYPDLFDDSLYGGNRVASTLDTVHELQFFGRISLSININALRGSNN